MKIIGSLLIVVGIALVLVVLYSFFSEKESLKSPIPEDKGVKVIFLSPTP